MTKQNKMIALAALGGLVFLFSLPLFFSAPSPDADRNDYSAAEETTDFIEPMSNAAAQFGWVTAWPKEEMTGERYPSAAILSENKVALGSPYGDVSMTMNVVDHPREPLAMYFRISAGQIVCGAFECEGEIAFDGKVERLSLVPPSDYSSEYVFAKYPQAIIRKMAKADKVSVALTLYRQGAPAFNFSNASLAWPPKPLEIPGAE